MWVKFVVLSCCYSVIGDIWVEGVIGIVWVFFGVGVRLVFVILWVVDDNVILEFMCKFY